MLLVVCQLSRDVIGYEDSYHGARFDPSIVTVKARERCLSMFLPSSSLRRFLGVRTIWREQIGGEW